MDKNREDYYSYLLFNNNDNNDGIDGRDGYYIYCRCLLTEKVTVWPNNKNMLLNLTVVTQRDILPKIQLCSNNLLKFIFDLTSEELVYYYYYYYYYYK